MMSFVLQYLRTQSQLHYGDTEDLISKAVRISVASGLVTGETPLYHKRVDD